MGRGVFQPLYFFAVKVAMIIKLGNKMNFDANNQNRVINSAISVAMTMRRNKL